MTRHEQDYLALISAAREPQAIATLALAGVIAMRSLRKPPYNLPVADLDSIELRALQSLYFPGLLLDLNPEPFASRESERVDEFDDLLSLLMEHRSVRDRESRWLAHAVATASMAENHLWQDMGLPNRDTLSRLMAQYFTSLASQNTGNMKWKKFFYRQLCARAGLSICRSPSCDVCCDYQHCFGPEESKSNFDHVLLMHE